ncbi:MAG: porin family protein [Gammaproteobacteria bacterium]|nr:porin family protein [Gammaproteobacteria bacterium]
MKNIINNLLRAVSIFGVLSALSVPALANDGNEMWKDKKYVYVLGSNRVANDDSALERTQGFGVGFGYFLNKWSIETVFHGEVAQDGNENGEDAKINGISMHVLKFPFDGVPGLFGKLGFGISEYSDFTTSSDDDDYLVTNFKLGGGYIHKMVIKDFEFGIRLDATYVYGTREERLNAQRNDINSPHTYRDMNYSLGVVIPF